MKTGRAPTGNPRRLIPRLREVRRAVAARRRIPPEAGSKPGHASFAGPAAGALLRIGSDGRLSRADARALRRHAAKLSVLERSTLLSEPELVLGPFASLPSAAQRALKEALGRDDRWRMAAYNLGAFHAPLSRRLREARKRLRMGGVADQAVELLAAAIEAGPARAVYAAHRAVQMLTAKVSGRPKLGDALAAVGTDLRELAVCYVPGIRQLPAYRGFWHDAERHSTVGLLVGVDLIENAEGYWFIESNLEAGLGRWRAELYEEDPIASGLVAFTATRGYRRLITLKGSSTWNPELIRQIQQKTAASGLAVTHLVDPFRTGSGISGTIEVPEFEERSTLLVRSRHYRTNLDYVIQHKRASSRALRLYKEESGDSSFQLPRTSTEPCSNPMDAADPFPNLVFKFPERDFGEGVFFLKVGSVPQAHEVLAATLRVAPARGALGRLYSRLEGQQGLFQAYVGSRMTSDRRLSKIRAYVLLSPGEPHFLSAVRMLGDQPVPEKLPMGVVQDQRPYLVTWRPGSRFEALTADEVPGVRQAALGIARGLCFALSFSFESGPGEEKIQDTNS